jgi:hypothetical protein
MEGMTRPLRLVDAPTEEAPPSEALLRWERGNQSLFVLDREAYDRLEAAYRASMLRSVRRHPSMAGRA